VADPSGASGVLWVYVVKVGPFVAVASCVVSIVVVSNFQSRTLSLIGVEGMEY